MTTALPSRNHWMDATKAFAIFAVILIHTHPFGNFSDSTRTTLEVIINQLSRFAVPFFFLASGYFLHSKIQTANKLCLFFFDRTKYLLKIYFIWCLIYIFISFDWNSIAEHGYLKMIYWKIMHIAHHPIRALFKGTAPHLWFLPSLITSLGVVLAIYHFNKRWILPITLLLYVSGVLGGAYEHTAIGFTLPFDTRDGPFLGSLFLGIGFLLHSKYRGTISLHYLVIGAILSACLQILEVFFLWKKNLIIDPTQIDFVFSTLPFALFISLIALSLTQQAPWRFGAIGKITLGIYLTHELFVELLFPLSKWLPAAVYAAIVPFSVLVLSIVTVQGYRHLKEKNELYKSARLAG